jgi:hypothetical protein
MLLEHDRGGISMVSLADPVGVLVENVIRGRNARRALERDGM